jgi:hypothetical protein
MLHRERIEGGVSSDNSEVLMIASYHSPFWANRQAKSLALLCVFALTMTLTGRFIGFGFESVVPGPVRFLAFPLGLWLFVEREQPPAVALSLAWLLYLALSTAIVAADTKGPVFSLGVLLLLVLGVNVLGDVFARALSGLQ